MSKMTVKAANVFPGTDWMAMVIVTMILNPVDSKTLPLMTIFKLIENLWESPTGHGHCHQNIEHLRLKIYVNDDNV